MTASGRVSGRTLDVRDLVSGVGRKPSRLERALSGFLLLGAVAIVLCTSRNGLISLVFAAAVTSAAMQYSRRVDGVGWSIAGIGLGATVVLLLLGVDPVIERFEAISAEGAGGNTRLDLIRDWAAMAMAFAAAAFALASFSATDGAGFSAAGSSVAGASFDASAAAPASAFASSAESHRRRLDLRAPSSGAASASSALRFSALPPAIAPARANPSAEAVT